MQRRLLLIGGIDPSGGAGLAADIEAAQAIGVGASIVPTALTLQNNEHYIGHEPVSGDWIGQALRLIFEEQRPDAIKIGMLASLEQARVIAKVLSDADFRGPLVWDTVFKSSSGGALFPIDDFFEIFQTLKPHLTGITPNLLEAEAILGVFSPPSAMIRTLYTHLHMKPPTFILLKDGHGKGEYAEDLLFDGEVTPFRHRRLTFQKSPRGTGCRLASALAAFLAQGMELKAAVEAAQEFVRGYLLAITGGMKLTK